MKSSIELSAPARAPRVLKAIFLKLTVLGGLLASSFAGAQVENFAGNAQHTSNYATSASTINQIMWQKTIDDNPAAFGHFGAPVVTAANTIIIAHKTATDGYQIDAYDSTGTLKYSVASDYVLPTYSWVPPYQPVLVGTRLYYPGVGGTVDYIDDVDTNGAHTSTKLAFYGLANYTGDQANFNSTLFINTPITSDSSGNIFFGFRAQGTTPAPLSSTQGGIARISSTGVGSYVFCTNATSDANLGRPQHGSAIAVSNDESTIYTYMRSLTTDSYSYLVGLDSTTLATKYQVFLWDPRSGDTIGARCIDQSTASPTIGPDGDVYAPVFANPYNGSRGFLLHFSGDLSVQKTTGAFGWDNAPAIVPVSMVPSYIGSSSYLIFCKYNNYTVTDGDGVNRVAILDPNETQTDFHPTAPGFVEMREVMSVISPTPDAAGPSYPWAVREWCINAGAVNPSTNSILFNNEDGHAYRWDTVNNVLSESLKLNDGIGQPYVPTIVGPDGTVYTLNGGNIFALGGYSDGSYYTVTSSSPNMRSNVAGSSITFTAKVNGGTGTPTGTFDFIDDTYNGLTPEQNILATGVAVDGAGEATFTTSSLAAGGTYFGNHQITAVYSGDAGHVAGSGAMLQKVHAFDSSVAVGVPGSTVTQGTSQTITATVTSGGGTPTGYVFFHAGSVPLGQAYLDGSGLASITTSNLPGGNITVTADYDSDTQFASSSGSAPLTVLGVSTLTASPIKFRTGLTSTGTVTLSANAPVGGTVVNLTSDSPNITVPASVTVPASSNSATFTINGTNATNQDIMGTITAVFGGTVNRVVIVAPDNQSTFVSQSVPASVGAGATFSATLTFNNTGTATWDPGAGYTIKSQNPAGNTTWGAATVAIPSNVAPGGNMVLTHNFTAPSTPGTYKFMWNMAQNNAGFGALSTNVNISVGLGTDASTFVSQSVPTSVGAGATFSATITFNNSGTTIWDPGTGYTIKSQNPAGNTTWGAALVAIPGTVNPGSNMVLTHNFTAPVTPGTYNFMWNMAKNNAGFGAYSTNVKIAVGLGTDASTFVSQSVPTAVGSGSTFSATMTFNNSGTTTWDPGTGYAIKSQNPAGNTTWGAATYAIPGTVAPGNNMVITQNFTAPVTPGTYNFMWNVSKNNAGFGAYSTNVKVVVSDDAAQYISKTGPTTVNAGADFFVQNTMKNTGASSWTSAAGYYMMSQTPANNITWAINKMYLPGPGPFTTGTNVTMTGKCTAPITPGMYQMQWQMTKVGGSAFGDLTPLLNINVVLGPDNASFVSQSGIPATIAHGSTFNATITMKNLGTATWTSAGGYSLKSQNPAGNSTWGVSSIPVTGSIAQNGNAVFTQVFTAPNTPGTYQFQWRMSNSSTPFGQYTTNLTITVN